MTYSIGHTNAAYFYGTDYGRHAPYDQYEQTIPLVERAKDELRKDEGR